MKAQLETRLQQLRDEYQAGVATLDTLKRREDELRATLLRISGAIQVLEEMLADEAPPDTAGSPRLVAGQG